jgi:hypothetical protein
MALWQTADARQRFTELVEAARGGSQLCGSVSSRPRRGGMGCCCWRQEWRGRPITRSKSG